MIEIKLIPYKEFKRVNSADIDKYLKLQLLADMCRANTIASVKRAGSGHLGSSLSSLDIVTALYFNELNISEVGISHPDRDIYHLRIQPEEHPALPLAAQLYQQLYP